MKKLFACAFVSICLFEVNLARAFELADERILIEEVLPLFNLHEKKKVILSSEKGINPAIMTIPASVMKGSVDKQIDIIGFAGETVFKDMLIKTSEESLDVSIEINSVADKGIEITPRIVTNWYQAGSSTAQKKVSGQLTYELLLSDDRNFEINDKWVGSNKGGWVYEPPDIKLTNVLTTSFSPVSYKRILLKIAISQDVKPGVYDADFEIVAYQAEEKKLTVPVKIEVKPVTLSENIQDQYKLLLFSAFKLGDEAERKRAYVNAMRLQGKEEDKEKLYLSYLNDIREHGFNGITIRDWDSGNLEKTLELNNKVGLKHIVLHATTPIRKKYKKQGISIVSEEVKALYEKYNTELYYYGYDERGGNKSLNKQLKLNEKIHAVGGKSVNAVFWDDMSRVVDKANSPSQCFDIVAHSMGSHGNKEMFRSLPYKGRNDACSKRGTEYLTYWHSHVENPVVNRIFSGFWLWASGFDGLIPHGYYFPSHVEKILSKEDIRRGVSNVSSPYDDWSRWLPGKKPLRHHNAVYPSKDGPIGTLQWEGVLSGVMDLKYVLTLEAKLDDPDIEESYKDEATVLLEAIRNDVLQITSPYMNDKRSIAYLKKLERWKKEISSLLLN